MRRILFLILITSLPIGLARGEDLSQYKTADELWNHLETLENTPPVNDRAQYIQQLGNLRSALLEFETRFGSDPRRWDAKLLGVQIESMRAQVEGRRPDNAALLQVAKDIVSATDAPSSARADARFLIAKAHLEALARPGGTVDPGGLAAVEADIAQLGKDYSAIVLLVPRSVTYLSSRRGDFSSSSNITDHFRRNQSNLPRRFPHTVPL